MATAESPPTSPELLRLLGEADNDAAWRRFLARYDPLIRGWCLTARLQPADAEDVRAAVCEGLLKAMKGFRYDPARRFRGYLAAAVKNAIRKFFQDRRQKPGDYAAGGDPGALEDRAAPPAPDDLAESLDESLCEDLRAVFRVVELVRSQVTPDTWRAYQLTAIDGRTAAEAAAELGKSVAAVYMAKSRVGKLLREEGGRWGKSG